MSNEKAIHTLPFCDWSKHVSQQPLFVIVGNGNNPNYDLYSVDIYNCTKQLKGSTGHPIADIAFTPDGRLWGISGSELYRIDTSNASITLVVNHVGGFPNSKSLVELNDSILLIDNGGIYSPCIM